MEISIFPSYFDGFPKSFRMQSLSSGVRGLSRRRPQLLVSDGPSGISSKSCDRKSENSPEILVGHCLHLLTVRRSFSNKHVRRNLGTFGSKLFNVWCDHLCLPQADTGIAKYLKVDAPACTMENDDDLRSELTFWSQVRNTWIFYHLIFPGRSELTPRWTTGGSVMKYQKYFMTKLPLKDD